MNLGQTIKRAIEEVQYNHFILLGVKPANDSYLAYVLVKRNTEYEPYVTWLYNSTGSGFNHGHYFTELNDAIIDFEKR